MVFYKGQSLKGAYVSAACQYTITPGQDRQYVLTVRSGGQYKVIARYEDRQRNVTLYGEGVTGRPGDPPIQPNATVTVNITLTDPPACMRNIFIQGIIRCDADISGNGQLNSPPSAGSLVEGPITWLITLVA